MGSRTIGPFARSFYAILVGSSIALATSTAAAEPAAPAALAQSLSGDAKVSYEDGRLLSEVGDYAGALTKFKRSYDTSKDARLLWNMAACEKELRHYARAASLVHRYLAEGGSLISNEQRKTATDTETALRAFYSTVLLVGAPDGASVQVDDSPAGQTPLLEPLRLDLGTRRLRVDAAGYEPFLTNVEVPGSNQLEVSVKLVRALPVVAVAPRLSITSSGPSDIISIDGKALGSRHWEGTVAVGAHTVRVSAAHKKPYEAQVELAAGSSRSLDVKLEDESHRSTLWYWVAGGTALAAGAVVGGYFLFKPEDTPGAHPSGTLTTIFLPASTRRGSAR